MSDLLATLAICAVPFAWLIAYGRGWHRGWEARGAVDEPHHAYLTKTIFEMRDDGAPAPHNALLTLQWLLVVPRTRDVARNGASVNALAFAGLLLGDAWRTCGDPVAVLAGVTAPAQRV